jgi:hypothetical protein
MTAKSVSNARRGKSLWLGLKLGLIALAAAAALFPLPPRLVDRFYSNSVYPLLQSGLTSLSNLVSLSFGDLMLSALVLALPIWWIIRIKRARGRRLRTAGLLALNTLALVSGIYLGFLALWGLNYQREPLMMKLDYDEARLTDHAMGEFSRTTIARLNMDSGPAHREPWPNNEELRNQLLEPFDAVVTELGRRRRITPAAPKRSLVDPFLGATGVAGFTNPFGLEVILNSDLLQVEKPFTLAHEWAHLAGFADESEANFVALLACARSNAAAIRYSGWLSIYPYLQPSQSDRDRVARGARWDEVLPPLAAEVSADLHAIAERAARRISPTISRMQSRAYDGFLKANRVEEGVLSYGLFVRLVLGTRFDAEWSPARQPAP